LTITLEHAEYKLLNTSRFNKWLKLEMKIDDLIIYLTPEMKSLSEEDCSELIKNAKRGKFSLNEIVVVAAWFQFVLLASQKILERPLLVDGISFSSFSDALLMAPFMCLIYLPIYIKKMKRLIKIQILMRSPNISVDEKKI